MFKRCMHKWEVKVEHTEPPKVNIGSAVNFKVGGRGSLDLLKSTHIVILACEKCGKLYRSVTKC